MNRLILLIAIPIALLFLAVSCKSKFEISGKWLLEKEEMYINGNLVNTIEGTGLIIEFWDDGTGYDQQGSFRWEINSDLLTIIDNQEKFEYTIATKSATRLVIEDRGFSNQKKNNDIIILTLSR